LRYVFLSEPHVVRADGVAPGQFDALAASFAVMNSPATIQGNSTRATDA